MRKCERKIVRSQPLVATKGEERWTRAWRRYRVMRPRPSGGGSGSDEQIEDPSGVGP